MSRDYTGILEQLEDRFWDKVNIPPDVSQCWYWVGATMMEYPSTTLKKVQFYGHKLVLTYFQGHRDNLLALHKCNTKACVNPSHLYWGTARENRRDHLRALGFDHV